MGRGLSPDSDSDIAFKVVLGFWTKGTVLPAAATITAVEGKGKSGEKGDVFGLLL